MFLGIDNFTWLLFGFIFFVFALLGIGYFYVTWREKERKRGNY